MTTVLESTDRAVDARPLDVNELRQRLCDRRAQLGWSQIQLAAAIGVTQSAVSDMERGFHGRPSLRSFLRWADALGMDLELRLCERADMPGGVA